jgi:hypothetical protein
MVEPLADTYANEGARTANLGSSSSLSSRGKIGATSYLRFAFPRTPVGKELVSASLRMRTTTLDSAGSADAFDLRLTGDDWNESELTWINRPYSYGWSFGEIKGATNANAQYQFPLNEGLVDLLGGTTQSVNLVGTGADSLWFWSSNHAAPSYRPALVLTYR